jgi:hypothetical protein
MPPPALSGTQYTQQPGGVLRSSQVGTDEQAVKATKK